jgi:preprotein translocase subunit SecD
LKRGLFFLVVAMNCLATSALAETLALHVETAHISEDEATGGPTIVVKFDPDSTVAFGDFTRKHVGEEVRLKMEGSVVSRPNIVEPILGGVVAISGDFTPESAMDLVKALNSSDSELAVEAD